MRKGPRSIEEIEVDDKVWSKNDQTGEEGFKPVKTLFVTHPTELIHLKYRREMRAQENALRFPLESRRVAE